MAIYSGFTHWKLWFSIVMLVYQRVRQTAETTEIDVLHHFDEKLQHSTLNNLWFQAGHEEDHGPQTRGQDIPGDRNSDRSV